jgi:hypothetical protein
MSNWIATAPARTFARTVAGTVTATILAAVAASGALAQTQPSPTTTPKALPRSFNTPAPAVTKTAPLKQAKSCSSYGDGFVNVPGTDTCIIAGGYMRSDAGVNH